jgi:YfiH family protein
MTESLIGTEKCVISSNADVRLEPLRSRRLSAIDGIVHGMTCRVPGLGRADGNVGLGAPRDAFDAWEMRQLWSREIGFDPASIAGLRQIHGCDVLLAKSEDAGKGASPGSTPLGAADALITNEPGVTLMTLHADCLPILVVDPDLPAVAAIHAGWRGSVEDVACQTIRAMNEIFGSDPARLQGFFGPSIGPCCYEVGTEVAYAWESQNGSLDAPELFQRNGAWVFDLRAANLQLLTTAGMRKDNIEIDETCTKCTSDRWFSHRGQGADTGRFGAFIAIEQTRV